MGVEFPAWLGKVPETAVWALLLAAAWSDSEHSGRGIAIFGGESGVGAEYFVYFVAPV